MRLREMSEKMFMKYQLKKIKILFQKIDREFYKIDTKNRQELNDYHNEYANIEYCIRWGLQASEELINKDNIDNKIDVVDKIKKMSFDDAYNYLRNKEIGNWDNVNSEDIIKQYCINMISKGIHVSHILKAIEENPSKQELYAIWLGNSMETPTSINNVNDLLDTLELKN